MDRRIFLKNILGLGVSALVPNISYALGKFASNPSIIRNEELYPTIVFFLDIHENDENEDSYYEKDYELLLKLLELKLNVIGIEGLTLDKKIVAGEKLLIEKLLNDTRFNLIPLENINFDVKKANEFMLVEHFLRKRKIDILIIKEKREELFEIIFKSYKQSNLSFPESVVQQKDIEALSIYFNTIKDLNLRKNIFMAIVDYLENIYLIAARIKTYFNEEPTYKKILEYEKKLIQKYSEIFSGEITLFDPTSRDKYNDFLIHQREIYASKIVYDYITQNNVKNFVLFFGEGHRDGLVHLIDSHFQGKVNWIFIKN